MCGNVWRVLTGPRQTVPAVWSIDLDDSRLFQKRAQTQVSEADHDSDRPGDAKVLEIFPQFFLRSLGDVQELALELQVRVGRDGSLVPLVAVSLVGGNADGPLSANPHALEQQRNTRKI